MFWCEACSVFVSRDADACASMRDIDVGFLREQGRLPVYTRANRERDPRAFTIPTRMRRLPAGLQGVVDALPVAAQAFVLFAVDNCGAVIRELAGFVAR